MLAIVFSYLIGSIPVGLIVARIAGGIDIREHGSGNIGLTNVVRTLGWGPGLVTGVIDFLKGYIPVYITIVHFKPEQFSGVSTIYEAIVIMVAAAIMLGNFYPVYLLFKGGKGIATGLGVMSALLGVFIFIPLAIFGIVLFAVRYVSLASITAALTVPLTVWILSGHLQFIQIASESTTAKPILLIFTWLVVLTIFWRHKNNISRILKGTEPKIGKLREPKLIAVGNDPGAPLPEPESVITNEAEEMVIAEEDEK